MPRLTTATATYWDDDGLTRELFDMLEHRPAWWAQAACRTAPADVTWFPQRGDDVRQAVVTCSTCPVRPDCLDYAMGFGESLSGIWGGLSGRERRLLRHQAS